MCERNPISGNRPEWGSAVQTPTRSGAAGKANSLRANRDGRRPAGPEAARHGGQSCETNPICHPGQAGGVPAGAKHAKQTQFGPAWAGPSPGWTKDAKQSQTWVDWGIWGMARAEPVVRNKANYQRSSRSDGCGTDNREPSAAIRHRMPATPASRMTTGIGFTGRAGRVTLSVKSIVGCES
jgi:hypothetical protein